MTAGGDGIPLAVLVTASGHGGGRCAPLSASVMGCAACEPGVRCGRVWGRLLSPSLPLSLKCGCSVSSLGSAASSSLPCSYLEQSWCRVAAVVSASGAWVWLCPAAFNGDGFVLRLRLLVASVPGSPAGGCDGACLTLD